jgi:hypothetical protein
VLAATDNMIYVLGPGTGPAGQVSTIRKFNADGTLACSWLGSAGIGAPRNLDRPLDLKSATDGLVSAEPLRLIELPTYGPHLPSTSAAGR